MLLLSYRRAGQIGLTEIGLLQDLDILRDRDIIMDIAVTHSKKLAEAVYPDVDWSTKNIIVKDTSDTTFAVKLGLTLNQAYVYSLRDIPILNDVKLDEIPKPLPKNTVTQYRAIQLYWDRFGGKWYISNFNDSFTYDQDDAKAIRGEMINKWFADHPAATVAERYDWHQDDSDIMQENYAFPVTFTYAEMYEFVDGFRICWATEYREVDV